MGLDFDDEKTAARIMRGAESYGRQASAVAHEDIARVKKIIESESLSEEDREMTFARENMIVVRLKSGGLLLYAPVKIREETELGEFLKDKGPVEWIVAPSSEHNLQLPAVIEKYPNAKIVATELNEKKLQCIGALPRGKIDYDYTKKEDIEKLNEIMKNEGVEMAFIDGDCCTNALFLVAHRVVMECDILYTHDDGDGILMLDQEEFRQFHPKDTFWRIFKYRLLSKPNCPHGFLPPYRYWSMDPQGLWPMVPNAPLEDGSSSITMAQSLRKALSMDFDTATGVHFKKMDAEKFRRSIDANWNWLDGKSLSPNKLE